jgi:Bacterial regulatory proteins, luxR family
VQLRVRSRWENRPNRARPDAHNLAHEAKRGAGSLLEAPVLDQLRSSPTSRRTYRLLNAHSARLRLLDSTPVGQKCPLARIIPPRSHSPTNHLSLLTSRERQVLAWLVRDATYRKIGAALKVSPRTIARRTHPGETGCEACLRA